MDQTITQKVDQMRNNKQELSKILLNSYTPGKYDKETFDNLMKKREPLLEGLNKLTPEEFKYVTDVFQVERADHEILYLHKGSEEYGENLDTLKDAVFYTDKVIERMSTILSVG